MRPSALVTTLPLLYLGGHCVYLGHVAYAKRAQLVRLSDALQTVASIEALPLQPETPGRVAYDVQFSGRVAKRSESDASRADELVIVTASGHRILVTDPDLLRCNCDQAKTTNEESTAPIPGHQTVEAAIAQSALVSCVWLLESVPLCDAAGEKTLGWAMVASNDPALVPPRHFLHYGDLATLRHRWLQNGDTLQTVGAALVLYGLVFVGCSLCHFSSRR
ncbi:hypothetical protein SDRG_03778 [Saprolegnia diclina VS20]|uniref:Uncharacterized protein n=1 Tax=Saprolegnia diclina (strain VS20) TaxID=1156394 RepID=T0QL69_SAPDV|nr:hypothetical protein SDRG_03778 [Saprolegnia diclina VS20]EQC38819.1 hypothetical protein SDRG_03778 [Saprolegnia diclina VS20]|eukprot:XP_008607643.1 hypothetical protein SDRG_03778 [Saprolegnia diclina VS20]